MVGPDFSTVFVTNQGLHFDIQTACLTYILKSITMPSSPILFLTGITLFQKPNQFIPNPPDSTA
jgi:hypothetical protein